MNINATLLDKIYDVPLGKATWTETLQLFRDEVQSASAFLFVIRKNKEPLVVGSELPDDDIYQYYRKMEMWRNDPWHEAIQNNQLKSGQVLPGHEILDFAAFRNTSYYKDFWSRWGLEHAAMGRINTENGIEVFFCLPRMYVMPAYDQEEVFWMDFYLKHMKKSLELEGLMGQSLPDGFYKSALEKRFELTDAEASLVRKLVNSDKLSAAAEALNRSYNTVKTQMASIYRKTDTNSQTGLMKKLFN